MAKEPGFVVDYLKQVETLAEDVIADRREIIELNKKRDKTREAYRAFQKSNPNENKVWLCSGNMFIKFSKKQAQNILEKDQNLYDSEINKLEKELKVKVNKLYEAENKPELKGYNLTPLSKEDKESLREFINY